MNLAIDIGNTAVKWATFEGRTLTHSSTLATFGSSSPGLGEELKDATITNVMVCASGDMAKVQPLLDSFDFRFSIFDSSTPLPIKLDYKTPETLGADRVADACGAVSLCPGEPCLVIDAGTCITVDFVDARGVFHGGAIMPGLRMNLQALHTFTAKLPLIDIEGVEKAPVLGRSTEESILAGTLGATLLALAGYVALYKEKAPGLRVLLTGGDAEQIMGWARPNPSWEGTRGEGGWEHVPHLTLIGLNEIMIYNEK